MSETVFWNQSWLIFTISFCLLLVIVLVLLCCLCWERKDNTMHHFYILDENGLKRTKTAKLSKNISSGSNLFRRFSSDKSKSEMNIHENAIFTSASLPIMQSSGQKTKSALLEDDELTRSFDKSILKFSNSRENSDDEEEARSCISTDSKNTFYSIHPRRASRADTFVSIDFEEDKILNR